jgi:D-amino-acid dehydrogenase
MKIIVIGAGVFGASTAYHLARAGAEVVIVDAAHAGRATAAGAGIVSPWSSRVDDPDWYRLASGGGRYYPQLLSQLAEDGEDDTGYRRVGALSVAADAAQLAMMERLVRSRLAAAPEAGEISMLSAQAAREMFPPLREDLAAVHVSGAARVDGRKLAAALLRAAAKYRAVRRDGLASVLTAGDRVTGVRIDGQAIDADVVVVTAGAWAPQLLLPIGIRLAVEPQRGQIVHLRLPGVETGHWPVVLPLSDHYLLTFDSGRVVVGATRETGSGFDYRVTAAGQAKVLHGALAVAPGLGTATIIETRIGFRPMPPGTKPLFGLVPERPGLAVGNGLGASGLTIGPYAGRLLAQLVLQGSAEIDLLPYRLHV